MFKKKEELAIKGKTDEELELALKRQTLKAKLYFLALALVLLGLVFAYKLIRNSQRTNPPEDAGQENAASEPTENGENAVAPSEQGAEDSQLPLQSLPQDNSEGYYISPGISPDDSAPDISDDSAPDIIEEPDAGDSGPQEEIIEY